MRDTPPTRSNFIPALLLGSAIAVVAALWVLHVGEVRQPSPLTQGLPSSLKTASAVFNARVQASFPPGTTEKRLLSDLSDQGFVQGYGVGDEEEMVRRHSDLVCNIAARIYWRADGHGGLRTIRGIYREEGCW